MSFTLLVTGFGPFGGRAYNPSGAAVAALAAQHARGEAPDAVYAVLPVRWREGPATLRALVAAHRPTAVLLFGQGGLFQLTLERCAYNATCLPAGHPEPDDTGDRPAAGELLPGASPVRRTPFDHVEHLRAGGPCTPFTLDAFEGRLRTHGIPVGYSENPGRFLCNALYHVALAELGLPAVFVHVAPTKSVGWDPIPDARVNEWVAEAVTEFHGLLGRTTTTP